MLWLTSKFENCNNQTTFSRFQRSTRHQFVLFNFSVPTTMSKVQTIRLSHSKLKFIILIRKWHFINQIGIELDISTQLFSTWKVKRARLTAKQGPIWHYFCIVFFFFFSVLRLSCLAENRLGSLYVVLELMSNIISNYSAGNG